MLDDVILLAYLRRRLTRGVRIVTPSSSVRPSVRRPSASTIFKDLLWNRLADQSQIKCGASMVVEN